VAWLEETALTAGTFRSRLEMRAGNAGATRLYAALGYRELARVSRLRQGKECAILHGAGSGAHAARRRRATGTLGPAASGGLWSTLKSNCRVRAVLVDEDGHLPRVLEIGRARKPHQGDRRDGLPRVHGAVCCSTKMPLSL